MPLLYECRVEDCSCEVVGEDGVDVVDTCCGRGLDCLESVLVRGFADFSGEANVVGA